MTELNDRESAVVLAIKPGFEMLVLTVPMHAHLGELAAADALATLRVKKLVKFEGRGTLKSVYLTEDGEAAYAALAPDDATP